MFSILAILLLFSHAYAQDANCDFRQIVQVGVRYVISNPNDNGSGNYGPGRTCRWLAECPVGYQCRLDCVLEIPLTSGCSGDRLSISRSGDPLLTSAETYCGRGTLTGILSINGKIAAALQSVVSSPGGRFYCNLTAQAVPQPQQCRCGEYKGNRIVGGNETGVGEYRMMAGLVDRREETILCGAVIIAERYLLSAAHCTQDRSASSIFASVGNRNLLQGTRYNINSIRSHPSFNPYNYDYDIAVLLTDRVIVFNEFVTPVCLPFKYENADPTGIPVTLLGWGTIFFGGPTSSILLKTDVTIIRQSECIHNPPVTPRHICTRTPGKDACQNDSGGPCLYLDYSTGRLFNFCIISFGDSCGTNNPAVHTRVPALLTWIVNNTPSANYCRPS